MVGRSVKHQTHDFGSIHELRVMRSNPISSYGLGMEPALNSLSLFLSLCHPHLCRIPCTHMTWLLTTALSITANCWKQPRPATRDWFVKLWSIHTVECHCQEKKIKRKAVFSIFYILCQKGDSQEPMFFLVYAEEMPGSYVRNCEQGSPEGEGCWAWADEGPGSREDFILHAFFMSFGFWSMRMY